MSDYQEAMIQHLDNTVRKLKERVRELEDGSCRFNCRTNKTMFLAGWRARQLVELGEHPDVSAEIAYDYYNKQQKS